MSVEPTPDQLAAVLRHPNAYGPPPDRFEGGRGPWRVESKYGDIHLTASQTTGEMSVTAVLRLDYEALDDLELALKRAREARDNYRRNK